MNKHFLINEIKAEKILSLTNISLTDYVINHYIGCQHKCLYCYAKYLKRSIKNIKKFGEWGNYVNVKINSLELLKKEFKIIQPKKILLGSITEVYQPIEKKYQLTKKILEFLSDKNVEIIILTRNNLILRDLEILKEFPKATIFFSFTSSDDELVKQFEFNTPAYLERLKCVKELKDNNINIWAHIGPVIPFVSDLNKILSDLKQIISKIDFESLNVNTAPLDLILKKFNKETASKIQKIYSDKNEYDKYWENTKNQIKNNLKETNIKFEFFFHPFNQYFKTK